MDKLIAEFADLMKQLKKADPKLHKKFEDLIKKVWTEIRKHFGGITPWGNWF